MASWEESIIFVFAERKSAKFSHRAREMVRIRFSVIT